MFFKKLMDILALDLQSVHYEKRELILDAINQVTVHVDYLVKKILCQVSSKVKQNPVCFQMLTFFLSGVYHLLAYLFFFFFFYSYSVFLI